VALAAAYLRFAWKARGGGYANKVVPEGWKTFRERVQRTQEVLEEPRSLPAKDPERYRTMPEKLQNSNLTLGLAMKLNECRVAKKFQLKAQGKGQPMITNAYVATDSQLGRSAGREAITRSPLMNELVARGVRITGQRRVLVGIIQNAARHLDAARLLHLAQKQDPEIDRATVYRTIALLKKLGLIDELDLMHLEGEKHYYEARTSRDHCHLTCLECGAVMEYASSSFEKLKAEIAKESGFQIRVARLELGGLCKRCRKAA
jgi:Fur family transcriptional regulator, ferric uptake regulator